MWNISKRGSAFYKGWSWKTSPLASCCSCDPSACAEVAFAEKDAGLGSGFFMGRDSARELYQVLDT